MKLQETEPQLAMKLFSTRFFSLFLSFSNMGFKIVWFKISCGGVQMQNCKNDVFVQQIKDVTLAWNWIAQILLPITNQKHFASSFI